GGLGPSGAGAPHPRVGRCLHPGAVDALDAISPVLPFALPECGDGFLTAGHRAELPEPDHESGVWIADAPLRVADSVSLRTPATPQRRPSRLRHRPHLVALVVRRHRCPLCHREMAAAPENGLTNFRR